MPTPERTCVVCGGPLRGRVDAKTCGPRCRADASRLRRLLSGANVAGYPNLSAYVNRAQRRAKRARAAQ